jgi:hypothetical protein
MEIKIDTKKDSANDIRKMIEFLERFIAAGDAVRDINTETPGMMSMFGDDAPIEEPKEDDKEDKVKVETY